MKTRKKITADISGGTDYMMIIEELRDDLERDMKVITDKVNKMEENQGKTEFRSRNNESRIDSFESILKEQNYNLLALTKDIKNNKTNLDSIKQKIKNLKELTIDKVDIDIFEQEISCMILYS